MPVRALRRGAIVRIRDERWSVCGHVQHAGAAIVDVRGCDRTNRGRRARFLLPFEHVEQLPGSAAMRIVSRRRWQYLARQVLASATPACDSLQTLASARIDLLPFQLEPALAVVRGAAARILLADEVGLGKTVQAGLIVSEMLARRADARVLVVCPASLRQQWALELEHRFGLQTMRLDSAAFSHPGSRALAGGNPWSAHPLIVTSVDFVKRPEVLRALEDLVWDALVIDEAHGLAGRSDRHAAATVLGERARTLVMLTATPHSGDDEAFRRLCGVGDVDRHFPLAVFRRTRHDAGIPSSRRTTWLNVTPSPVEVEMHRALMEYARLVWHHGGQSASAARLAMVVLMKRACSSAASLARSVERRLLLLADPGDDALQLALPLGGTEADDEPASELGAPGLPSPQMERSLLENILRLARLAQHAESKPRLIRRLLQRTAERAIVFTEYRDTLASLAAELAAFSSGELHGGLAAAERELILERFVTGTTRLLLATDAASEGLNLQQRCRLVINLEVPWTPLRLEQRIGRVDRIGQRDRVHQLLLVAGQTEEQSTIAKLVRRRAARASEAVGAMRRPSLEEGDIAEHVFGGDPRVESVRSGERHSTVDLPDDVMVVDLRARAAEEAARAAVARLLRGNPVSRKASAAFLHADPDVAAHPFAAATSPRASRGCWAFRLCAVDSNEAILWETIIGIWYRIRTPRFHDAGQVLEHLQLSHDAVLSDLKCHCDVLLSRVAAMRQVTTALAIAREEAIVAQLEHRHARLAASLLQPTLFGHRRTDRETAAQRAVVQDALSRCSDRLASLTRQDPASIVEPVFAVICR